MIDDKCFLNLLMFTDSIQNPAALVVNTNPTVAPLVKRVSQHPTSATIILLPDGRRMAYRDQGVSADQARFSMILPHHFLSSRLAGTLILSNK